MSNKIWTKGNILIIGSKTIPFNGKIKDFIIIDDSIIVLIEYTTQIGEQNIFCYNFSGKELWQIPLPIKLHTQNYYTGIYLRDEILYAYSISGVEYELKWSTGEVVNSELIK